MEKITITQLDLATLVQWSKLLIARGEITKKEAEITINRIVKNNKLSPIYLW